MIYIVRQKRLIFYFVAFSTLLITAFLHTGLNKNQPADATAGKPVPIIMYHSILKSAKPQDRYIVSPYALEEDLKYLKTNGRILYSTCTLRKAENDLIIERFLSENNDFSLQYSHTFMPHIDATDGFYCALLIKK